MKVKDIVEIIDLCNVFTDFADNFVSVKLP